jgi:hypothetical protein
MSFKHLNEATVSERAKSCLFDVVFEMTLEPQELFDVPVASHTPRQFTEGLVCNNGTKMLQKSKFTQ